MIEEWRPVVGYEGLYEVSDRGRVRSRDRFVLGANGRPMRVRGRVLQPYHNGAGRSRLAVKLAKNGLKRGFFVHALVLTAFVGARPDDMVACHNDGNESNNYLGNLRWDTQSENMKDAIRHGTHPNASKASCLRGHPLVSPNLVPSQSARGFRQCRACQCAATARRQARLKGIPFDIQQVADQRYAKIMAVA